MSRILMRLIVDSGTFSRRRDRIIISVGTESNAFLMSKFAVNSCLNGVSFFLLVFLIFASSIAVRSGRRVWAVLLPIRNP